MIRGCREQYRSSRSSSSVCAVRSTSSEVVSGSSVKASAAGFLRAIGEARLITPLRSGGGHRRYSRYQLRIAARARELVDQGTAIEAACRIVILEDQLEEAQRINAEYRRAAESENPTTAD
ncbi:MerR family transcriptional regulator (plasmid) [Streptomyces sp. NBC_00053]|uniref:MerR family transcriptional regulator n=1 Tax=unclassified Streptomyces TaxID=2593676 RepID=UPI0022578B4C|nr:MULTISPECIES: MerR family transcriptional regulator [unclassified Streptomyces]MCX4399510.1 MerR family transcriptional regulator [Streptomyces sp. NBC_01767]MCX4400059.1 MerR family transcriptional regulator [Streptomyces sp. NBC_01767]MCX5106788.1 MerR family transcriptional regulator [Streptomyces sp. NBC_00439]MCX5554150.1 MerR family transcriptional regulator [Streptomyces sp. NBC_00051]